MSMINLVDLDTVIILLRKYDDYNSIYYLTYDSLTMNLTPEQRVDANSTDLTGSN